MPTKDKGISSIKDSVNKDLELLKSFNREVDYLSGNKTIDHTLSLKGNIERFIGYTQVPTGLAGPITIHAPNTVPSQHYIPMATTEGALVASYNRGLKACELSGGITSVCIKECIQRSPYFKLADISQAIEFVAWVKEQRNQFQTLISTTSRYATLSDINFSHEGNSVIITFEYTTGDAAGQNMTTIATSACYAYILAQSPYKIQESMIESNYSGDKKGNIKALSRVRGKQVVAEATLSSEVTQSVLKATPEMIVKVWRAGTLSGIQSGTLGNPAHIANALAAIYLACGQDVACVAESAVGIVRMEVLDSGDLYCSLTLTNLIVGTIGGGTGLATQRECLGIIGCSGPDSARKFAEVCCAVAMAGELSIAGALSAGHFAAAHQSLGRKGGKS